MVRLFGIMIMICFLKVIYIFYNYIKSFVLIILDYINIENILMNLKM